MRGVAHLDSVTALRLVRFVHTLAWALFAGAIIGIPIATHLGRWRWVVALILLVLLECAVLAFNRMRCPLTDVAARYTNDRRDNFDIYLPEWLARHNKVIFGTLYALGVAFAAVRRWG